MSNMTKYRLKFELLSGSTQFISTRKQYLVKNIANIKFDPKAKYWVLYHYVIDSKKTKKLIRDYSFFDVKKAIDIIPSLLVEGVSTYIKIISYQLEITIIKVRGEEYRHTRAFNDKSRKMLDIRLINSLEDK